ncbi:MAG: MotA/TolQ/ExbB proton channel family protein [Myxococcota bacterium]
MQLPFILTHGGVSVYALLVASVLALGVFFERLFVLRRAKIVPPALVRHVNALVLAGKIPRARQLCRAGRGPLAALYNHVLQRADQPLELVQATLDEQGSQVVALLQRRLPVLGTVASIAPLLGILGTVLGMIKAFHGIAQQGFTGPLDMAEGIWEALLSTALGLVLGIGCLIAHRFLLSRAQDLVLRLQHETHRVLELVHSQGRTATQEGETAPR